MQTQKPFETTFDLSILTVLLVGGGDSHDEELAQELSKIKCMPVYVERVDKLPDAVRRVQKGGIDAVLLDIAVEGDTFRQLQRRAPQVPVIILTDLDRRELALELVQRGAQDYLVKGELDLEMLFKSIRCAVERRRAEERTIVGLEREKATIKQILEFAPVGIVRLSRDLKICEANQAFIECMNLVGEEVVGRNISDVVFCLSPGSFHESIASDSPVRLLECPLSDDPARPQFFNLLIWPTKSSEGVVTGFVLIAEDVTNRVQIAAQRDEFVATLAHDMKVPLVGAERFLQHVLTGSLGALPNQLKEGLEALRRSNKHVLWMVHNLLFAYQEQAGAQQFSSMPAVMRDIVAECVQELSAFAESKNISLVSSVAPELPVVLLDRGAVRRLLINLLDNAIKYSGQDSQVFVSAFHEGAHLRLQVKDNGRGIPKELLPTLFQRFWRAPDRMRSSGSTGLGLYVCRRIAEGHQGTIQCDSEPGKGTTFDIILPLVPADEELHDELAD
ncbi:MAG TPA: ATP-binding protein [Candidatus Obscuribacterales bacterium]